MAIDINVISINVNGLDDLYDYADVLQELAQEIENYIRKYRDSLELEHKKQLRTDAKQIQNLAEDIATQAAIEELEGLETELSELKGAIKKADGFLTDVENAKGAISAVAKVIEVAINVLKVIP